jgi:GntR family transcriptional regulator
MHIQLNPSSGVPIYRQIVDEVRAAFLDGHLREGERLPSVRQLASELGINPATVVKAYDQLEQERLIARRQGQGAFVSDGVQPLLPEERERKLDQLTRQLAINGRRLGYTEREILRRLQRQLKKLRPPDRS